MVWALITVLIWAGWPVATRLGLHQELAAVDLVAIRFGIGGFLFLPLLLRQAHNISARAWREGVWLTLCQGVPLVLLMTVGLKFAPASHASALSPGVLPLFTTLFGFVFYDLLPNRWRLLALSFIIFGVISLLQENLAERTNMIWLGDLLFLTASAFGSIYTLRLAHSNLTAVQGSAIVNVYSMLVVVPLYLTLAEKKALDSNAIELAVQVVYQGVLMGAISLVTLSKAITSLGPARSSVFMSLDPVLTIILAIPFLGEFPSVWEIVGISAITLGVLLFNYVHQEMKR